MTNLLAYLLGLLTVFVFLGFVKFLIPETVRPETISRYAQRCEIHGKSWDCMQHTVWWDGFHCSCTSIATGERKNYFMPEEGR